MRGKLTCSLGSLVFIVLGITSARASTPSGFREALAEFETGATRPTLCAADRFVGGHKEISRFQILPAVWRKYSDSPKYQDPQIAWGVASRILRDREQEFRQSARREWDYVDMYLLWNAPGQYRRARWDRSKVSRVVRERAQRFGNLMEEHVRVYNGPSLARN